MPSAFSWPVLVPSALRAPAPINLSVRPLKTRPLSISTMDKDTNLSHIAGGNEPAGDGMEERRPEKPYYVVLPCEVKDFRKFVSGLLGKPQELRGEIEGLFQISHQEISTIYHLLEQRMSKQNDSTLVHFGVTVYYDDGQSVVHNSIPAFEAFHPVTPCVPTGVIVTATYLIKFRGHDAPEKQEIEVTIATNPEYRQHEVHKWFDGGLFEYRVVHTERTWATDISGLLRNHAQTILKPKTKVAKFVSRHADELTTYFALTVAMVSAVVWAFVATAKINVFPGLGDVVATKALLSFFVRSVVALLFLASAALAVRTYVENNAYIRNSSGILLTEHDKKKFAEERKQSLLGWVKYGVAWSASIASGVLSSVIYSKNWFW